MPSALSVPICEPTSRSGACIMRTSADRNAKHTIIAIVSVIAIFTIVHRRSSRCSRNGLEVSLSGSSRNLKMSRSAMLPGRQLDDSFRDQTRPHAQGIGVANGVVGDHGGDLRWREFAAFQNHFGVDIGVRLNSALHRPGEEQELAFVGESRRGKEITEENRFAIGRELVTGFLA